MPTAKQKRKTAVTPETYNTFLQGLELKRVRLVAARVEANVDHPAPSETEIRAEYERDFKNDEGGFEAFASYRLEFVKIETGEVQGVVEATFGLQFDSPEPMREDVFEIFGELNLKVNSWPYAREYVQTNMGRMDWPGFTLPLMKPSLPKPEPTATAKPKRKSKKKV